MKSPSNNCLTQFRLDCGVDVYFDELFQWRTYAGLLAGVPDEKMNKRRIMEAKKLAAKKVCCDAAVHLINPKITIESRSYGAGNMDYYPVLPAITCVAVLKGPPITSSGHGAALIIIWYQDQWALPVDPAQGKAICVLPWADLAKDYEL